MKTHLFFARVLPLTVAVFMAAQIEAQEARTWTDKASGKWDSLEKVFEDRVARALSSLGVPSKKDIDRLTKRITELTALVQKMSDAQEGKVAKPAVRTTAAAATAQAAAPKAAPVRKPAATKSVAAGKPAESADAVAGAATAA